METSVPSPHETLEDMLEKEIEDREKRTLLNVA